MNTYDFKGKTVAVTGGANGIGAAVVDRMVQGGAKAAIWDIDSDTRDARLAKLPAGALYFPQTDVADMASVTDTFAATQPALGPVDVFVDSDGFSGPSRTVAAYPFDTFRDPTRTTLYVHIP